MATVAGAVLPVVLLIAMGFVIKQRGWIADAFWSPAERLTYYLFFPALLVRAGMNADLAGAQVWPMALSLAAATLAVAVAAAGLRKSLGLKGAAFTSFFQGAIRPNTYVGVAIALFMYGEGAVALLSIAILAVVPMVNLIAVPVMLTWGDHAGQRTPQKAALEIARNPLVLACLIGFGLGGLGVEAPGPIAALLDILGRAALPVALLAVGAGLDLPDLKANAAVAAKATAMKLVLLPALAWVFAQALGVHGLAFQMTVLYAALTGSASSYVLAREMGGDAPLMAGIITATTLAGLLTMPVWVAFAG